MKPTMKKPRASVSEMDHTNVRRKAADPLAFAAAPQDYKGGFYHTSTMFYPKNHPMRVYRDAKKAAKRARNQ